MNEIIVKTDGAVMSLIINRPDKLNAINFEMFEFMHEKVEQAKDDDAIRVVHLSSKGEAFSAGADLAADANNIEALGEYNPVTKFVRLLTRFPKPVVAAVPGMAVGIGTTMLFHCDLVYASSEATFRTPFTSLALVPEAGSSFLLSRMAGHQTAAELLLTGRPISAERAREMGFVTGVLEPEQLDSYTIKICQKMAELPPVSLKRSKELMRQPYREAMINHMESERTQFIEQLDTNEFRNAWAKVMSPKKRKA